jgi:predicted nuclease with TOPRIM domain
LTRRYLDKKTKDHFKRLVRYEDDEKKHVTESGPHIPEFEEALQAKRMIFLKDINADPQAASEIINERIDELLSAASETSEYIKTVNNHLDKQKLKVDELKKLQKIFEKQISDLESNDSKKSNSR